MSLEWRPQHEDSEIGGRQNDSDIVVPVTDRGADDSHCPDTGRGIGAHGDISLSHNCTRADETDTGDYALQDICVVGSAGPDHRYSGLYQPAASHRDERKRANASAMLRARPMPPDRQREKERHHQMDEWSKLSPHSPKVLGIRHIGVL